MAEWGQVFTFDLLSSQCGFGRGKMQQELKYFSLPCEFPKFRQASQLYAEKRGPPDEDCQLDPRVDQYDAIDPPAPED